MYKQQHQDDRYELKNKRNKRNITKIFIYIINPDNAQRCQQNFQAEDPDHDIIALQLVYKHKCQKQQDIRYDRCIKINRKNLACELIHFFLIAPVFCSFSYCISGDAKSCDQRKVADNRYGKIVFSNRIYLKYSCDIRKCDQWKYQRQYRFHNIEHCV